MKSYIKKKLHSTIFRLVPDKIYIKLKFRNNFGYFPNLKNPSTFNEKIQWLKINKRYPLQTICVDKYLVRNFISKIIGKEYLIPLLNNTFDPKDIVPEFLPDTPCIIKTNHDSGGVVLVYDKTNINWKATQKLLYEKMKKNYYYICREWPYKNIKPRIIIEELLLDKDGNTQDDYRIYCFNGKAKLIVIDENREKPNHSRYWFNTEWKRLDIRDKHTVNINSNIKKPKTLNKMISLSEKISNIFTFLRVDWYEVDGKLYIGELTFYPAGGFGKFESNKWDSIIGNYLDLNS